MNHERIGIVLAAGAERVIPWEAGVLAGLLDAGYDPRGADVIAGTSAGSLPAARLPPCPDVDHVVVVTAAPAAAAP